MILVEDEKSMTRVGRVESLAGMEELPLRCLEARMMSELIHKT